MFLPVILAGGAGTRLWPVSREMHPKPFMRLADNRSLLQKTLQRIVGLPEVHEILTVTNKEYYYKTQEEYAAISSVNQQLNFLLEPFGRNTAPAIGLAACYAIERYGASSTLLILPADHLIKEQELFYSTVNKAYELAQHNKLITFGIKPHLPQTEFGYIKLGKSYYKDKVYSVEQFVEKPNKVVAQEYLKSGQYLWNSGMFCFKAKIILQQLENLAPDIFHFIKLCWQYAKKNENLIEIDADTFAEVPNVSIDYAVMEKSTDTLVIGSDFQWNDVGSWSAVSELISPDEQGNKVVGDAYLMDVTNSFIQSTDRLVAAIGIKNLTIVDTPDALLIAEQDRSQDVKKIVSQLKQDNHATYKMHRTVHRPWGSYTVLEEGAQFKIKRIVLKPGAAISLQLHNYRSEHWVVVSGKAQVMNGDNTFTLQENESTFIPIGNKHRLENPGLSDLVIIEVQTGQYVGEDDIVRFEDKYHRV